MKTRKISNRALYAIMAGMLLAGTANTVILKTQNVQLADYVDPKSKELVRNGIFNHPFFQTALMFLGEATMLFVYVVTQTIKKIKKGAQQEAAQNRNKKFNVLWLLIPTCCDFCGSSALAFSLIMIDASVYQMLCGSIVIITAGLARCFNQRKQYRHHIVSLIVIFVGLLLVGVSSVISKDDKLDTSPDVTKTVVGIILLLLGQTIVGSFFVIEEKILGNFPIDPMLVVGWEGFFGFLICIVALPILQVIACTPNEEAQFCTYHTLENTNIAFAQMKENGVALGTAIGVIFSIGLFNLLGVYVTKYASAAQRSTVDTSRTVLIWLFFLLIPIEGAEETFHSLQLLGFILLVIGTLIYNEILIVSAFGFDRWTRAAIEKS